MKTPKSAPHPKRIIFSGSLSISSSVSIFLFIKGSLKIY
ncbi:putative membrane protein [Collimonas pratensis]|uniref:Putative membrane protein n=1 Tax=Collimonas pratensis TaxID=279113 RepID=A0A127Q0V8_9BURK|nr:putative membrane protein [Collimonas pratensis]